MSEKQQKLVYAIIDFLNESIKNGIVKADDQEGLEVAIQCIGEAFGVDPSNEEQSKSLSVKPADLQSIFDVYLKTRAKVASTSAPSGSSSGSVSGSSDEKVRAERLKQMGNGQMSIKDYDAAIKSYTEAIALDSTNPVYYSNRAAAHSSKGDHLAAVGDAEQAIAVDPNFVRAYHRLGHAQYCLSDYAAAADAFERGLKMEPGNTNLKSALDSANARIKSESESTSREAAAPAPSSEGADPLANMGGMADMMRNMGMGGGAGGGMPDLASMMNNPQLMAMAQQLASNGGLANIMQNPAVANMMERVQSGNMPSMEEIMSDPAMRQLANQFAGGRP